jgi:hypothetical protein
MTGRSALPLALWLASGIAHASGWQAQVDADGLRTASRTGEAQVGVAQTTATLTLQCRPGPDGKVGWLLAIDGSAGLGFAFSAFDGPNAAAAARSLAAIEVTGGMLRPRVGGPVAGSYDGIDRFVFAFSARGTTASQPALLADAIGSQSEQLEWRVTDFNAPDNVLTARFALDGAAPLLHETMMGCGPPPPIGAAERDAWRGRNPLGIDLFAQRAVQWRLKGLLGNAYADTIERLARAEPLGVDGDTLFVLAPDPESPRSGVAIVFSGDETEIVIISEGVIERRASRSAAIPAPAAVRDFVASRIAVE